jgi:hypothetical protein
MPRADETRTITDPEADADKISAGNPGNQVIAKLRTLVYEASMFYRNLSEVHKHCRQTEREQDDAIAQIARVAEERAAIQLKLLREMKALMPRAVTQARAGKPALLRMILRATR